MISKWGKMSPCCGLLRHFVEKISHLGVNVPHNDMAFLHVITRKDNGQVMNGLKQSDVVILTTVHQCHPETLTPTLSHTARSFTRLISSPLQLVSHYKGRGSKIKEILNQVQNDYYKKVAFTLEETLITLGIIGVVAAMTIPNLITNHQKKQTVTKLQKAISVLNQAYKLSYDENGDLSPEEQTALGSSEYFKKYWESYIKVNQFCETAQDCGYASNPPMYMINGELTDWGWGSSSTRTLFSTMDGFVYFIISSYWKTLDQVQVSNPVVFVDLNGGEKPNRLGRDIFELVLISDGKGVQPYGTNLSNDDVDKYCSYKASIHDSDTVTCVEKIKRAGWTIDSSYPWK